MKEKLILRILDGSYTEDEKQKALRLLNEPGFEKEFDRLLSRRWEAAEDEDDLAMNKYDLLKKIHHEINGNNNQGKSQSGKNNIIDNFKNNIGYYLQLAATILIFIGSGFFTTRYLYKPVNEEPVIAVIPDIIKTTNLGEKLHLKLPDGTFVILNSSSSIQYPSIFSDSVRSIKLAGEAYFEVMPDKTKPFRVATDYLETTVVGTKFNINVREEKTRVTLTEGKVMVSVTGASDEQKVELAPGQMAVSDKARQVAVEQVEVDRVVEWKNGKISFRNKSLAEIITMLQTWYAVDIKVEKDVNLNRKVNGEFNNENLENILTGLSFSLDFQFTLSDKKANIKR